MIGHKHRGRVLLFLDPFPLRNSHVEFSYPVAILIRALATLSRSGHSDFIIYANEHICDYIGRTHWEASANIIYPTQSEQRTFDAAMTLWTAEEIRNRVDHMQDDAERSILRQSILERIIRQYGFDAILTWSDVGGLKEFAKRHSVPTLFGELGPTRPPFYQSLYFDPFGTNGGAIITRLPDTVGADVKCIKSSFWSSLRDHDRPENERGPIDSLDTYSEEFNNLKLNDYIYIPLQLADDLNTAAYSKYNTPLEFLNEIMPVITQSGLTAVVKGHPGAPVRALNLWAEEQALEYCKGYGDRVVTVRRDAPTSLGVKLAGRSVGVMTINSSVGYEAMLIGRPVATLGSAVYDINNKIQALSADFAMESILDGKSLRHASYITSVMGGYYLNRQYDICWTDRLALLIETSRELELFKYDLDNIPDHIFPAYLNRLRQNIVTFVNQPRSVRLYKIQSIKNDVDFDVRATLDNIAKSVLLGAHGIKISGWAFSNAQRHKNITGVHVLAGKEEICANFKIVSRPDVNAHYVLPRDARFGFELFLPNVSEQDLNNDCSLVFCFGDQQSHPFGINFENKSFSLIEPTSASVGSRVRLRRGIRAAMRTSYRLAKRI